MRLESRGTESSPNGLLSVHTQKGVTMAEKISQKILLGELVVIVLPCSILLLLAIWYEFPIVIYSFLWSDIAIILVAVVALIAIISGLILSRSFITKGITGLRNQKPILWVLSSIALLLLIAAVTSRFLSPSPEYSQEEMFRDNLEYFILGSPILIPFAHLIFERLLRKPMQVH